MARRTATINKKPERAVIIGAGITEKYWRSLKVPWNNPILAKDSTYPIQEEWNISNAM